MFILLLDINMCLFNVLNKGSVGVHEHWNFIGFVQLVSCTYLLWQQMFDTCLSDAYLRQTLAKLKCLCFLDIGFYKM